MICVKSSILFFMFCIVGKGYSEYCPKACRCEPLKVKNGGKEWSRIRCQSFSHALADDLSTMTTHAVQLDLSSAEITELGHTFLSLPRLQRLDLSNNKISKINIYAFKNLTNLKRLDLSNNKINNLHTKIFEPLESLEKLKLNQNGIVQIDHGVFDSLSALKQLNISDNPLHCDCELQWLIEWVRKSPVKLVQSPKCESPEALRGQPLRKLKLPCHVTAGTDTQPLEIKPMHNQIVFEGDSLSLRCRSMSVGSIGHESRDAQVVWSWKDKDPSSYFDEIKIQNRPFDDLGFVESQLQIDRIQRDHSGDWHCHLLSDQGNHSSVISVIVISEDTKYCPQLTTKNNKGVYIWPKTVVGFAVELPCEVEQITPVGEQLELRASHMCNASGSWEDLNTSQCPYVSETTKVLEQFSRVNLTIAMATVLESAKRLRNFTGDGKMFVDVMDIVFLTKTIENYLTFVKAEKELGPVLLDIVAAIMQLPQSLLYSAQKQSTACSRIVRSVEVIANGTPTLQVHKSNLAVEEFGVTRESFLGITCVWYSSIHRDNPRRFFHCSTSNKTGLVSATDRIVQASIQIPSSLFYQLEMRGKSTQSVTQLIIAMYENNNLFPMVFDPLHRGKDVSSCVVGSSLVGIDVNNLTDPVFIMLRAPILDSSSSPKPVWWDPLLNNGSGNWSPEGCRLAHSFHHSHYLHGLIAFHCERLGYFGLLQDTSSLMDNSGRYVGAKARLCHPAVYSGAFVLVLCLIVSVATYMVSHSVIQMSRRAKHSIVNTWVAMSLLCFMFCSGIYQTEELKVCQSVGLILHYLSLSTLLWMSVTANNMYKRLSKSETMDSPVDDELPSGVPIQKPILGLYLVGWGIGLIVCGISGAVNLRDYAGQRFCFLCSGPALSAIFVPATMLIAFLFAFYSLTLCAIRNNDSCNGQLSEGTQGTENVDLELLEVPTTNGCVERRSVQSVLTGDSDDVEDPEHSPLIQLKAHVIVLVLYVLTWLSAALSITDTLQDYTSYQEDIFSITFCILAFLLGAFVLYFYCVARSDVRAQWAVIVKALRCRTRSVSDTHVRVQVASAPVVVSNGTHHTAPALSTSSVNSSALTNKSSHHSNRVKAVKKLNNCEVKEEGSVVHSNTTNHVNLVAMHRQMYRSNNSMPTYHEISGPDSAEAFYNPHQSIVARKFFRKQRRNKRNDLGLRRRGDGGGTSDGEVSQARRTWRPSAESAVFLSSDMENASEKVGPSLFTYGSKVNNTNIHVGQSSRHKKCHSPNNPNMLNESDREDVEEGKLPIDRLVIGAEEVAEVVQPGRAITSSSRSLSRVDEISVSEDVNSTAVNISEVSEYPKMDEAKERQSQVVPGEDMFKCRTMELDCSMGEHSCSDLTSEMNYCDSATNEDNEDCEDVGDEDCPPDCCSKLAPASREDSILSDGELCNSFIEKLDSLRLHTASTPPVQAPLSPEKGLRKSPPQYVTVIDPQFGLVKVTVGEYQEFSHKLSLAPAFDEEDEETIIDKSSDSDKTKKETSV